MNQPVLVLRVKNGDGQQIYSCNATVADCGEKGRVKVDIQSMGQQVWDVVVTLKDLTTADTGGITIEFDAQDPSGIFTFNTETRNQQSLHYHLNVTGWFY